MFDFFSLNYEIEVYRFTLPLTVNSENSGQLFFSFTNVAKKLVKEKKIIDDKKQESIDEKEI